MKRSLFTGITVSIILITALVGCGGGGSTPTNNLTPATRQETMDAVVRVTGGGGIGESVIKALTKGIGAATRARARTRGITRGRDTGVLDDGTIWTYTEDPQTGSFTLTLEFPDGSMLAMTGAAPSNTTTGVSQSYTATFDLPNEGGTLNLDGDVSVDYNGTPSTGSDDIYGMSGTLSGSLTVDSITTTFTGSFTQGFNALTGIATSDTTLNLTTNNATTVIHEVGSTNLQGTGTYTSTITAPGGITDTTQITINQDGTATIVLSEDPGGIVITLNVASNGTATGTVSINGQQVATIDVTVDGQATFTFIDNTSETVDISELLS